MPAPGLLPVMIEGLVYRACPAEIGMDFVDFCVCSNAASCLPALKEVMSNTGEIVSDSKLHH